MRLSRILSIELQTEAVNFDGGQNASISDFLYELKAEKNAKSKE